MNRLLYFNYLHAFDCSAFRIEIAQSFVISTHFAIADDSIIDLNHPGQLAHRAGAKNLVRRGKRPRASDRFPCRDFFGGANLEHSGAGNSFRTGHDATGGDVAFAHDEDMRRVRLGDETASVEHEGVVGAGIVRFDLGQNGIEQIGVMNLADREFPAEGGGTCS